MGLFAKLFGGEQELAPLDPASPEGLRMEKHRETAVAFASRLHDRLEVVPGERYLYAFVGKPPDAFGIAWFEGAEEHNLKTLVKARNLTAAQVARISDELRRAYILCQGEPRFSLQAGKKAIVVHPSAALEKELLRIIHEAAE